ncbi:MAG: TatD family hydrolase, partial [Vicinamibacterales bacterium]
AVGEIGLDYHYDFAPRAVQLAVFEAQLAVAKREDLPVVIHCREAEDDVVAAIERAGAPRGIFHCFTGDERFARRVVSLGFHVSFSGIVTFPKAESLRAAARIVPLERLLIETDSPFLAPVPHRGQRNEPAWVGHVAECIARLRGVSLAELLTQVHRNFDALCARSRPAATHGPE